MKFSFSPYWLKSGFFTLFQRLSILLFGVLGFMLLTRSLSKEEYGVYVLFATVTSLLEVARQGLIKNALVKYLASSEKEEHEGIITASFVLNILLTVLSIIILIGLAYSLSIIWNAPQLKPMFLLYIITTIALILFSQFDFIQQGNFDFSGIFYGHFTRRLIFFLLIVAIVFYKPNTDILHLLVTFETISVIGGTIVSYLFVRKYYSFKRAFKMEWISKLFHYGKFVFATNISSQILRSIDQFMLGSLVSPSAVALYNASVRITNFVEVPTQSISAIIFPESAKRMAESGKTAVKYLYEKSVGAILAMLIPGTLFVVFFPEFILTVLAGDQYLEAVPILQITIIFSLFIPYGRQFGTMLDSIGKPKISFYMILFTAVVNVTSNYFFISHFGIIGAAYGTLTSQIIGFVISQFILYKILDVNPAKSLYYAWEFYKSGYSFLLRRANIIKA